MAGTTGRSGGKRSNSGRKSNSEIAEFRALIDAQVSDEQWALIIRAAVDEAVGTGKAAGMARTFLVSYRFGLPTQLHGGDPDAAPISVIEIQRPNERTLPGASEPLASVPTPAPTKNTGRQRKILADAGGHTRRKNKS